MNTVLEQTLASVTCRKKSCETPDSQYCDHVIDCRVQVGQETSELLHSTSHVITLIMCVLSSIPSPCPLPPCPSLLPLHPASLCPSLLPLPPSPLSPLPPAPTSFPSLPPPSCPYLPPSPPSVQICRFCWHRIRTDESGLCPACRKVRTYSPHASIPHDATATEGCCQKSSA